MNNNDLPPIGSVAAGIDLAARLRVFDADGSLAAVGRTIWNAIEPEVRAISEAYWQQWQTCFGDQRQWAPMETERMIDVGCTFLRNRFLDFSGRAWVESIERSVAAAYVAKVSPMALLSMITASDRAAINAIARRLPPGDEHVRLAEGLLRLSALEGELTVAIYNAYREHSAQVARERLAAEFRQGVARMVESVTQEGSALRNQTTRTSN